MRESGLDYLDGVVGTWMKTLKQPNVLALLLVLMATSATAQFLPVPQDLDERSTAPLYIIVVGEALDENTAQTMALVIGEVLLHPVHLYRGTDRIMIVLTGYPVPLPDAEIIGEDLKRFDLFQDTPYPRFHPVESIDYCDRTGRCLEVPDTNRARSRSDI